MQQPLTLYLTVGYPGSGKTTVSKIIHELTGAVHLWADHERNKRFTQPTHSHKENIELYNVLNQKTQELLHEGTSVIFDTNFNFYKDRKKLRRIASSEGARTITIWITTPKELARQRAVEQSDGQATRIWGNMPPEHFDRIANNLELPENEDNLVRLDGTHITQKDVATALGLA